MKQVLSQQQVADAVDAMYDWLLRQAKGEERIAVIGVRTRGETLASRLVQRLQAAPGAPKVCHGVLDITFYRDDLSRRHGAPLVRATEIDFDLDGIWAVLIDDVLNTGRSVRAALDALSDFGRPKVIRLAVLADRGGRELPIAADFVGRQVKVSPTQRVQVRLKENDGEEGVFIVPGR